MTGKHVDLKLFARHILAITGMKEMSNMNFVFPVEVEIARRGNGFHIDGKFVGDVGGAINAYCERYEG